MHVTEHRIRILLQISNKNEDKTRKESIDPGLGLLNYFTSICTLPDVMTTQEPSNDDQGFVPSLDNCCTSML